MPYFIADVLGDGSNAEGNQLRPLIADLTGEAWSVTADAPGRGLMLVRTPHVAAFDGITGIRPMRKSLLANVGALDEGETDDWEAPDLARKIARRFLLRQYLGGDDFGLDLATKLGDLTVERRQRIRDRLAGYRKPIDISILKGTDLVGDALALILPQLDIQLDAQKVGQSGTFTDNFNGEASTVDLAAHTPSGGTAWTRVDGTAGWASVSSSTNRLINNTTDGDGALYQCDDQGSANQYLQYASQNFGGAGTEDILAFIVNRGSTRADFIGVRALQRKVQVYKRVAGTFTQLGSDGPTTVVAPAIIRLESSGDAHEAFLAGVSEVSGINDAHNNTITRQGVVARSSGTGGWADDFEAGVLGGGGATILRHMMQYLH